MAEADLPMTELQTEPGVPARRRWKRVALMVSLPLLLLIGGTAYWLSLQGQVSTENAYVKQDMVAVAAEVGGRIVDVRVAENQRVAAGDLLFRVDPEPYQLELARADAAIANAQAAVTAMENSADLSGADISAAREDIAFARTRLERQQALWDRGFTTKADYDAARHAVTQAEEALRQAVARQTEARARLAHGAAS
jgi:membrane fusion protein (multidrug efflux system)